MVLKCNLILIADDCNSILFEDEAFVYTCIDKEFYCPVDSIQNDKSSTGTHLAEAVSLLPVHNLLSSQSLSRDFATVHDRLTREDPFQVMYIFAAVDCNIEE